MESEVKEHRALSSELRPIIREDNERKSICFVIADEEVFFNRGYLIRHSPYIASLVQDLDESKVNYSIPLSLRLERSNPAA